MRRRSSFGTERLVLFLAIAVFVGLRFPLVSLPLDRDEGALAYIAREILRGRLLYRDMVDCKPPGVYWAYLVPVGLLGGSPVAIHFWLYVWTALAAAALYLAARLREGALAASFAALAFSVLTAEPSWQASSAATDQFMLLPMTASVACLLLALDGRSRAWAFASGALGAAAFWIKPPAAVQVLFLFMWAWRAGKRGGREAASAFALGAAAGALLVPACFWTKGLLRDLWYWTWTWNIEYARAFGSSRAARLFLFALRWQLPATAAAWILGAAGIAESFTFGWFAFSAAGVAASRIFRFHYFLLLAPALSWSVGRGVVLAAERWPRRRGLVLSLAAAALALEPLLARPGFWFRSDPAGRAAELYPSNPFPQAPEIARYLKDRTEPADRILVFGSEAEIPYLADRRSATRFLFSYMVFGEGSDSRRFQQEEMDELGLSPPRAVVVTNLGSSVTEFPGVSAPLAERIRELLASGYALQGLRRQEGEGYRMVWGEGEARAALESARAEGRLGRLSMLVYLREPR